jgi:hypothetical protein
MAADSLAYLPSFSPSRSNFFHIHFTSSQSYRAIIMQCACQSFANTTGLRLNTSSRSANLLAQNFFQLAFSN